MDEFSKSHATTPKKVGVVEIARAAGVSAAAVASVLRSPDGKGRVSAKTRLSILQACREMGYEPKYAQAFGQIYPEMGNYCFVLSSIAQLGFRNPYYSQLLKGIADSLPNADAHMHFCRFSVETDYLVTPKELPAPIRNNSATKILCAGRPNLSFVEALRNRNLPIVYLGHEIPLSGVTCVVPDFVGGVRMAIDHLVSLGHKRIAVASGPFSDGSYNILKQRMSVERAFKEHHLTLPSERVIFGELDAQGGIDAVNAILQQKDRPTALYCFNDMIAMGAISRAQQCGLRIPEDLSVVGFDDIWMSGNFSPPLTTVHVPVDEMGRRAVEEIEKMIRDVRVPGSSPHLITLPTEFRSRGSSGKCAE
jgi:DNA-binding LacI/PurR family transcriptional regulator